MNLPSRLQLIIALMLNFLSSSVSFSQSASEVQTRRMIGLRQIGHEFLLATGDSTSRVLTLSSDGARYEIGFEKPLAFAPDSLASVVERILNRNHQVFSFSLSVASAGEKRIVYGFTSEDLRSGKVPCIGREMPKDNYTISMLVSKEENGTIRTGNFFGVYPAVGSTLLSLLVLGSGLRYYRRNRKEAQIEQAPGTGTAEEPMPIGAYWFFPSKQQLAYKELTFALTAKEQTLLTIFLKTPNTVIDRNKLLKEGWEDQGVITRRSLDMYVSRLRKKLHMDQAISISNEHGKGYSLNID